MTNKQHERCLFCDEELDPEFMTQRNITLSGVQVKLMPYYWKNR